MGLWSKIGKVLLTAAPYVAAPFTGGASLAATGLANKAVQKWSEKDAKKAISKGLAPSKFDQVLGKVGGIASLATSVMPTGALGNLGLLGKAGAAANAGSKIAKAGSITSKVLGGINRTTGDRSSAGTNYDSIIRDNILMDGPRTGGFTGNMGRGGFGGYGGSEGIVSTQKPGSIWDTVGTTIGDIMNRRGVGGSPEGTNTGGGPSRTQGGGPSKNMDKRGRLGNIRGSGIGPNFAPTNPMYNGRMGRQLGPAMNEMDQSNPNLALSIAQGRTEALKNRRRNPMTYAALE